MLHNWLLPEEEELLNELSELKLKYNTAAETSRQHFLEFQLQSTEKASLENAAAQAKARLQESHIECEGSAALCKAETRLQYYVKQGVKKKLKCREEKLAEKVAELRLAEQKKLSRKRHVLQICLNDVKCRLKLALGRCQQLKQQHPDPQPEVPNPSCPRWIPWDWKMTKVTSSLKQSPVSCCLLGNVKLLLVDVGQWYKL